MAVVVMLVVIVWHYYLLSLFQAYDDQSILSKIKGTLKIQPASWRGKIQMA
ncbi:hypothetical protein HanPSC8_Chr02g0080981 [Helianthus annuus]|nr:hypothetical protein HanPSC8_Chr02g0080981 [Helianthus annuus]